MEIPTEEHALPRALGELQIRTLLAQGDGGSLFDVARGPRRVALKGLKGLKGL
jgi:hypothetical protein